MDSKIKLGQPKFLTNGPTTAEYCDFHTSTGLLQLIKGLSLDYQFAPQRGSTICEKLTRPQCVPF